MSIDSFDTIEIKFGKDQLILLKEAFEKILRNEGDFPIRDRKTKHILYFWWNPENE